MIRNTFVLILMVLAFQRVSAQTEKDTIFYFIKKSGVVVASRDSADYLLMNMPADTSSGKLLYPVLEMYRNGKRKLVGASNSRSSNLKLEGVCITFFSNGRRQSTITYENGKPVGDAILYYPNGQLYAGMTYDKKGKIFLFECRDSTGKELVELGEGRWPKFDEDYKKIIAEGPVSNGVEEGEWRGMIDDTAKFVCTYHEGDFVSGTSYDKSGNAHPFNSMEIEPTYKGGLDAFYVFLMRTLRYPADDREKNITGKVFVQFVVEKDGSLSDVKSVRAPSKSLGEAAVNAIKQSPKWVPGIQYGLPVRVQYTVPVNFTLNKNN